MTRSELLEVVYRFYPRGMHEFNLGYDDTEECQRQRDAARRGAAEYPRWKAMIRRLGDRYPLMDRSLRLLGGSYDPAYSVWIDIPDMPGHRLGLHVSLLGPYYGIHRTGAAGEEPMAVELAREIEATYRGYEPIPPELGNEVVPDVTLDTKGFGKATIYYCLLSEEWEWSAQPYARPPLEERPAPPARLGREQVYQLRPLKPLAGDQGGEAGEPDGDQDGEAGEPRG